VIAIIRYLIKIFFIDIAEKLIDEKRFPTPETRKNRAEIFCKWFFDIVYYSLSTLSAYLILKDQDFVPWTLFGTG